MTLREAIEKLVQAAQRHLVSPSDCTEVDLHFAIDDAKAALKRKGENRVFEGYALGKIKETTYPSGKVYEFPKIATWHVKGQRVRITVEKLGDK